MINIMRCERYIQCRMKNLGKINIKLNQTARVSYTFMQAWKNDRKFAAVQEKNSI